MSLPPDYDWSTFFFSVYADHEARPPDHDAADDEQFARSTGSRSGPEARSRGPETMADWLDEQEDPGDDGWVVHHAMLAGSLTLFLGAPESFKSFGALWLARSALTGEDWLGRSVERFDRVYYAGNEKTRTSLKQRAKVIFGALPRTATARLHMRHSQGLQFGNDRWQSFVEEVVGGEGTALVILDTLTSLARSGFDENTSKDGSVVLASVRALRDGERITVVLLHHPARAEKDRPRGWSGVDGEVDGTLSFVRPAKDRNKGHVWVRPKDGGHSHIRFDWDPDTFAFGLGSLTTCTAADLAGEVKTSYDTAGVGMTADELMVIFDQHTPGHVKNQITQAKKQRLIEVGGTAASGPGGGAPKPIYVPWGRDEPGDAPPDRGPVG